MAAQPDTVKDYLEEPVGPAMGAQVLRELDTSTHRENRCRTSWLARGSVLRSNPPPSGDDDDLSRPRRD